MYTEINHKIIELFPLKLLIIDTSMDTNIIAMNYG